MAVAVCPVCFSRSYVDFSEWLTFPFVRRFHHVCLNSSCGHGWVNRVAHEHYSDDLPVYNPVLIPSQVAHCPQCMAAGNVHTSHIVQKGMLRKLHCKCVNPSCNESWKEFREFEYTKSPSALSVSENEHPKLIYGNWPERMVELVAKKLCTKTMLEKKSHL